AKVSLEESLESFSVTSLVSCHLVNCVMDRIKICGLCTFCKIKFSGCSAVLSVYTHLKVLLCAVCDNLAQKLCKFSSMLCLFPGSLLPVKADLRITLSVSNSGHCQVHTNLRALALRVSAKVSKDVLAYALCNAYNVLSSSLSVSCLLFELLSRCMTDRTLSRSCLSLVNISTYCTNKFFHDLLLPFFI